MGFTISKNQGSGRTVITVTPEEKLAEFLAHIPEVLSLINKQ